MNPWQRTIRSRVVVAAALFAAWAVVIEARLVHLQVFRRADLQIRADDQRTRTLNVPARRGEIIDRNGAVLATSVDAKAIYAVPNEIRNAAKTAQALCRALSDCTPRERDEITAKLGKGGPFTYLRRANRVSFEDAQRVEALKLPGIGLMDDARRAYPNHELAAHLLGYVGTDNIGLSGLEAAYNKTISGRPGSVLIETDGAHRPFGRQDRAGTPGATLQLTIDQYLQHVAERELLEGVQENRAAGGSVVIMDPRNGEVLAIANCPMFDPNRYNDAPEGARRNRAIQDVYEPGSTFKIVTASAALQERVLTPDSLINASGGTIRIGSRVVRDTHNYGVLSFTDVLVKSSNVGAIRIGLTLGRERLGSYVRRFGFGTRLSRDMPGENAGIVFNPAAWDDSALASVSMGYQISVSPLQMATAASTVANGGELIRPRVVRSITTPDGVRTEVKPQVLGRAIEKHTAEQLTAIMEGVIERGTATVAKIPGYSIAGKTGTSHKLEDRHYSASDYNASFVAFLPSRNPVVTILVVIDSPHGSHGYYGGTVAAPVFKRIAEATMRYLGVGPNLQPAPVLFARRPAMPVAPPATDRVTVVRTSASDVPGAAVVPDLIGLSAREAIRVLSRVGMTPGRVSGDGVVVQQEPPPGSPIERGAACSLALGRPTAGTAPDQQRQ